MPRPKRIADDETTRLVTELQGLRKGYGLTRTKVDEAEVLCGLAVVRAEAARLGRPVEQVAYHLLVAAIHGLTPPTMRDDLIDAFVLDHTPPGRNLGDRRARRGGNESQVRKREDTAVREVALWLLEMEHPEVLFGDYLSETAPPLPPAWNVGPPVVPVAVDEVHPREEVVWDSLEKTTHLDQHGFATATETRGTVRAMADGVTGYTIHYTSNTGSWPTGIGIFRGGRPGISLPLGPLKTCRKNIDFHEPLTRHQSLQLHWYLNLVPGPDARPVSGVAESIEIPIRYLTLRAQFHDGRLPVIPRYFVGTPDNLPEPIGPTRPIKLSPGNIIASSWPRPAMNRICAIAWDWPGEAETGSA